MLEKQKKEAILRLKQLTSMYGLDEEVVVDLEEKDRVHCVATTLAYEDRLNWVLEQVNNVRENTGIFPYYVIMDPVFITILYVGTYEEDWERERPDWTKDIIFAYVINTLIPEYSEFGSVGIEGFDNVIIRTA